MLESLRLKINNMSRVFPIMQCQIILKLINKTKGLKLHRVIHLSTYVYLSTKFTYLSYHSLHIHFYPVYLSNLYYLLYLTIHIYSILYPVYLLNLSFAPSRPKYHNCQKIEKMVKKS